MNCRGAELAVYDQSISFNSWFNPSAYKVFILKIKTSLVSSEVLYVS